MRDDRRLVTRVLLRNYKSIAACDVSPAQLTFLVGPNGSGKSNFLDALRFVSDSLRHSLDHALRDRGGINEVRRRSSGHPTHFGIRVDFDIGAATGHFAFTVAAKRGGGYRLKDEECVVLPRDDAPAHYYRVSSGQVKSSESPFPATSSRRLALVSASGMPAFRPVYDAFSRSGFYNLNPTAIRTMQSPDPGDLMNRDGGNVASVLDRIGQQSPESKTMIEEYLGKVVPGITGVDRKSVGPVETLEFKQRVTGHSTLGASMPAAFPTARCGRSACWWPCSRRTAPAARDGRLSESRSRRWRSTRPRRRSSWTRWATRRKGSRCS